MNINIQNIIEITLGPPDPDKPGAYLGGQMDVVVDDSSDLGFGSELDTSLRAVGGLLLSMACAGIDIQTPAMLEAVETTLNALHNELTY